MNIAHPLSRLADPARRRVFISFLVWMLLIYAVFAWLNPTLNTPAAPTGIISFELAGSRAAAEAMTASWDGYTRQVAAFSLGLDYLFMPVYATTLAAATLLAAGRHAGGFARLGAWLGWGAYAAAGFDAIENLGLMLLLLGAAPAGVLDAAAPLAAVCAALKFILLLAGIVYSLAGWAWRRR
jgi:hypothetical protein